MPNTATPIDPRPRAQEIWQGLGNHFDSLTQILAEFIDNSIANFRANAVAAPQVQIRLNEVTPGGLVSVEVEDSGTGIEDLEIALRLGDRSAQDGPPSEHGYGVKHAIAAADRENISWEISTRNPHELARQCFRRVRAPYAFPTEYMVVDEDPWPGQMNGSGTLIRFTCSRNMFNAVTKGVRGAPGFVKTIDYLIEELGYIYAGLIGQFNLTVQFPSGDGMQLRAVTAVEPVWDIQIGPPSATNPVTLPKGTVNVTHRFGLLGEPPADRLRRYKRTMKTSGVEIRLNGRLIEDNLLQEIWRREPHNRFNHFLGQLNLTGDPRHFPTTRTNKDGFHEGDASLEALFEYVRGLLPEPPVGPNRDPDEADLRTELADRLKAMNFGPAVVVMEEYDVFQAFDTHPRADIYFFDGASRHVFELKRGTASVQDLYQLVMYWDGLVHDGITPQTGFLVASAFAAGVDGMLAEFANRLDADGNPYRLETRTWQALGIDWPPGGGPLPPP